FTILELLIVIAVISILVGMALPRFKGMQDEGNTAKAKGELRTIQTAVESIKMHTGSYPADITTATLGAAVPQIISVTPADPFNGANIYGYRVSTNGNYYVIYSVGPNGRAEILGIGATGVLRGRLLGIRPMMGDDIYVSNGQSQSGG
ncbi:MAG: type II secretion system protein, partial [Candidatus Omnitrophota bacterium]